MQVLAGLEANGLAGGNGDFSASAGVATNTGLARLNCKDAKAAKFNAVAFAKGGLHGFEDGVHGRLRFCARETGAFDDSLDEVLLDQGGVAFL